MGIPRNSYNILIGKPLENRLLGRTRDGHVNGVLRKIFMGV
jgi:hypothetical protein